MEGNRYWTGKGQARISLTGVVLDAQNGAGLERCTAPEPVTAGLKMRGFPSGLLAPMMLTVARHLLHSRNIALLPKSRTMFG